MVKQSVSAMAQILQKIEEKISKGDAPKVITTSSDGITDESTITTTLDNMHRSIQSSIQAAESFIKQEMEKVKDSVQVATSLSMEANAKIDNVQKSLDFKSIILRRIMFGDPLLEMVDMRNRRPSTVGGPHGCRRKANSPTFPPTRTRTRA
jgi:hypothetical protein